MISCIFYLFTESQRGGRVSVGSKTSHKSKAISTTSRRHSTLLKQDEEPESKNLFLILPNKITRLLFGCQELFYASKKVTKSCLDQQK